MTFNYRQKHRDFKLIFLTKILRLFSYGILSIVFFDNLFLKSIRPPYISWIQSGILLGDILVSLILTTQADRIGRVKTLMLASILKIVTGLIYAQSNSMLILTISGILGIIAVTEGEIGPFVSIEQSALSQLVEDCTPDKDEIPRNISTVFGYYNMAGNLSQAAGAAFAVFFINYIMREYYFCRADAIKYVIWLYVLLGGFMLLTYYLMNLKQMQPRQDKENQNINITGIKTQNLDNIVNVSFLFCLDAFATTFVLHSFLSHYYQTKYDLDFNKITGFLFVFNIISGVAGVKSTKIIEKIGLVLTMIYTHLPSNLLLIFIAMTSNPTISIFLLFFRLCISQMEVPARQTFIAMSVSSQERTAANGITYIARSIGMMLGFKLTGYFMNLNAESSMLYFPFLIAGVLKITYDMIIGYMFVWNQEDTHKKVEMFGSTQFVDSHTIQQEEENKV